MCRDRALTSFGFTPTQIPATPPVGVRGTRPGDVRHRVGRRRICVVEPDDEAQRYRPPPSPDDRLWRHPSEIGQKVPPTRRQLWAGGMASAVVAGVLSIGLAVVTGNLLGSRRGDGAVANSGMVPTPTFVGTRADAVSAADGVKSAIVQVKVVSSSSEDGSGVIFRSDGHILTSASLVEGATSVTVVLSTGRKVDGRVIGSDVDSDIAVVKIGGDPYATAELVLRA